MKPKLFLVFVTSLICLTIPEEATAKIRIIKGNNQSALTGTTLFPFVVSVTQPDVEDPLVGATMKFTIIEGSGSLSYEEVNTNHEGEAQTTLTLPDVIGAVVVQVQLKDNPRYARLNFTATAFAPSINFKDGSATFVINENTPAGEKIGSPVAVEGNTTNYVFFLYGGSQYFSVEVDEETGGAQLKTKAPLDFETRTIYTFEMQVVSEHTVLDYIDVTVNVLDVYAFTQESTTRSVEENVPIGTNIGAPVAAEELGWRNHRYHLGATADVVSFSIDNDTGQLKTGTALDYETKNSYTVKVNLHVWRGSNVGWTKQDTITITINVEDVEETPTNTAPSFSEGTSTTRSVTEKTPSNQNIGIPVSAMDADNNTLTYTLGGIDALGFSIDSSTGQLKTKIPLDYETKNQYTVTVNVSDGSLTDTITVTIDVTEIDRDIKRAPVFSEGKNTTRSIAENTPSGVNIGIPLSATDPDGDTFTYSLGGTDAVAFSIDSSTGQLQTKSPLDYETKNRYTVVVSAFDGYLSGIITVTINVTDLPEPNPPTFMEGDSTTRSIAENTPPNRNIGKPVSATDVNGNTLTYSHSGTDASSFSIDSSTGQLTTQIPFDYETKNQYVVTVTVSDGNGGSDAITVTINVVDLPEPKEPTFTEGDSTTRSIAENTPSGVNIGRAVSATDEDDDNLRYRLGGPKSSSFSIDRRTGQLRTSTSLDHEKRNQYVVTVTVFDGDGGSDFITVTIHVTDVYDPPPPLPNAPPAFTEGDTTRSIPEDTLPGVNIGIPLSATDPDGDTLTYSLSGTNAAAFAIDSSSGQLKTKAPLDYETKNQYVVRVTVFDGNGNADAITVIMHVRDVYDPPNTPPAFTEGDSTTRSIPEDTPSGVNIGIPLSATDPDGDTFTYSLGGTDAVAFSIDSSTGQLQTKSPLDYETKNRYTVVVSAFDGYLSGIITVTINVTDLPEPNPPTFMEGDSTTRSIAENTPPNRNIGKPVSATDVNGNTLTYSHSGTDASSFSIDSSTGQLTTQIPFDYETKNQYVVTVTVSDGNGGSDAITVIMHVTDVDESASDGNGGSDTITVIMAREMIGLQDGPQLQQNVPNPFNSETVITWFLLRPGAAHVEVFALTGQRVAVLHQGPKKAGIHRVHWDGRDDRGRPLASGVYLYRLVTNEDIQTRKLTLLR